MPEKPARELSLSPSATIQQGYKVLYRETHILLDELADAVTDGRRKEYTETVATVPLLVQLTCRGRHAEGGTYSQYRSRFLRDLPAYRSGRSNRLSRSAQNRKSVTRLLL